MKYTLQIQYTRTKTGKRVAWLYKFNKTFTEMQSVTRISMHFAKTLEALGVVSGN